MFADNLFEGASTLIVWPAIALVLVGLWFFLNGDRGK
jgi:hypothetical protein